MAEESLAAGTGALSIDGPIFVSPSGKDERGRGAAASPFLTPAFALHASGTEKIYVEKPEEPGEFDLISASALKKARKGAEQLAKKEEKAAKAAEAAKNAQAEDSARLEEAKKIVIKEDSSLPTATRAKIQALKEFRDKRVAVSGWIHRLRVQKGVAFIVLRDGTGFLQCVLGGDLAKAYQTLQLTIESTVTIYGEIKALPEGKNAPGGHELVADYYKVIGLAPGGDDAFTNKISESSDPSLLMDQRHLTLRGETLAGVMTVRSVLLRAFREFYAKNSLKEVTPPCMVQSMVEGGSTLFTFDYYGEPAYLTQSSQLYLETCVPAMGDVYCIQESFRAEKSKTRRHLSEYTHIEAELGFLTFDDLLSHIEHLITYVANYVFDDPVAGPLVRQLNPKFSPPQLPFLRMKYVDAIAWLNEHDVKNPESGEAFKFGDDIAEAEERHMTDTINKPILLTEFPVEIKAFYMPKCEHDKRVTESVDVLMPNVGEVVGGSMRIADLDELLAAFKRENMEIDPYYWFIDLRKYGTFPHGGYGLGTERILAWLCDRFTVRDCTLYPRYIGRCRP